MRAARKVRLAPAGGQDPLEKAPTRIRNTAFGNHVDSTNARRLVRQIGFCNREIGLAEKEVLREAASSRLAPQVRLPVSMAGIDACAAMPLAAETGGTTRFPTPRNLASMAGMCLAACQPGGSPRHAGRMKKLDAGRKLGWIMIHAAGVAARRDGRLKARCEHVKKGRGGGRAIAATDAANKTVRRMRAMLSSDEPYRHRNEDLYRGKLARLDRAMYSDNAQKNKGWFFPGLYSKPGLPAGPHRGMPPAPCRLPLPPPCPLPPPPSLPPAAPASGRRGVPCNTAGRVGGEAGASRPLALLSRPPRPMRMPPGERPPRVARNRRRRTTNMPKSAC